MGKDKAYETQLWELIKEQIPRVSKREARFRQVDKIPALGAFLKAYENDCSECLLYRKEVELVITNLPEVLANKGADLEREMEAWKTHLREEHGVYPDYYFNYRYGTFSFFAGLLLGVAGSYLFRGEIQLPLVGLITSSFLIFGVVYGSHLDAKLKSEGKNY